MSDVVRMEPPAAPQFNDYFRSNVTIAKSYGPLILPPLPHGNIFIVTSSLMQMLTARDLFSGLPLDDPYAYISKLR